MLKPLYNQKRNIFKPIERVCHESWCADGKHLCFVVRRKWIKVCNIEGEFGKEISWIAMEGPNAWHVSCSPKNDMLVCDTMWKDTGLWLCELLQGNKGKKMQLCLSKSEWQHPRAAELFETTGIDLRAHPHPGWSPDGRHVNFTRFDPKEGRVDVLVVDFPRNAFENKN